MTRNEQHVKEHIPNDLANHVIHVKHQDGLYRHYICQSPGTWNMGFCVVTWPGCLCYTGDMGEFLFERTEDMIAFMRGSCMSYCYAAEKCTAACRDGIREFSPIEFKKEVARAIADCDDPDMIEELEEVLTAEHDNEHSAMEALFGTDYFGGDLPDCNEYTERFLWCLHALKWFCEKLDKGEVLSQEQYAALVNEKFPKKATVPA